MTRKLEARAAACPILKRAKFDDTSSGLIKISGRRPK
jgi:hypothetical protein